MTGPGVPQGFGLDGDLKRFRFLRRESRLDHFNDELTSVNLELTVPPRPFTIAMMANAMPAAIRPYSIAVAPDSSDKKFKIVRFNSASAGVVTDLRYPQNTGNDLKASK